MKNRDVGSSNGSRLKGAGVENNGTVSVKVIMAKRSIKTTWKLKFWVNVWNLVITSRIQNWIIFTEKFIVLHYENYTLTHMTDILSHKTMNLSFILNKKVTKWNPHLIPHSFFYSFKINFQTVLFVFKYFQSTINRVNLWILHSLNTYLSRASLNVCLFDVRIFHESNLNENNKKISILKII